jgi:hypothetical protein
MQIARCGSQTLDQVFFSITFHFACRNEEFLKPLIRNFFEGIRKNQLHIFDNAYTFVPNIYLVSIRFSEAMTMFSSIAHISKGFELIRATAVGPVKFNLHPCSRGSGWHAKPFRPYADDLQQADSGSRPAGWLPGDQTATTNPARRSSRQ